MTTLFWKKRFPLLALLVLLQALAISDCRGETMGQLIEKGRMLGDLGRLSEAELTLEKAVAQDPTMADAQYWLGFARFALGKFDAAEACFVQALKLKPDHVEALCQYAAVLAEKKEMAKAEEMGRKALGLDPENPDIQRVFAKILLAAGKPAEAVPLFQKILERDPGNALVCSDLGCALAGLKKFDDAIAVFQKGLEKNPDGVQLHQNLALAFHDAGRKEEALRQFKASVVLSPDNAALRLAYAQCLMDAGSHQEAQSQLEVFEAFGNATEAKALIALLPKGTSPKKPAPGVATLPDEPLQPEVDPKEYDSLATKAEASPEDAHIFYLLGHTALRNGNYGEALRAFQRVVGLKPLSASARFGLAKATAMVAWDATPKFGADPQARYLPLYDEAEECYKRVLQLNPDLHDATIGIARIYEETKREKLGRELLEALLVKAPKAPHIRFQLARSRLKENEQAQTEALKLLEEELLINPDDLDVWRLRTTLFVRQKDFPKAIEGYQKVVAKDPERSQYLWRIITQEFPDWKNRLEQADPQRLHTFLETAAKGGDQEAVGLLAFSKIASGTPEEQTRGLAELVEAARHGRVETVFLLADQLINRNKTPIELLEAAAIVRYVPEVVPPLGIDRCEKALTLFLEKNPDIRTPASDGSLPLELALWCRNGKLVQEMLKRGADPKARTKSGIPLLFLAADKNILEMLIHAGADAKITDQKGNSLLHALLERFGQKLPADVIRSAIEAGVDLNGKNQANVSPIVWAIKRDHLEAVRVLIEKGADFRGTDEFGSPLLHFALSRSPESGIAELLVDKGTDVNILDKSRQTALHAAVQRAPVGVVRFLIEHGASVNATDSDGNSCLHVATPRDQTIIKLLLEKGANVNARNRFGKTPMHSAAASRNAEIIRLYIAKGADLKIKDNQGKTPYDCANDISATSAEILDLLRVK